MPNPPIHDWRDEIAPKTVSLKLQDGESADVTHLDEGVKNTHPDFGDSIAFRVCEDNEPQEMVFYVKPSNYALLNQIKELGLLTGVKTRISRTGSKRSDTRYKIEKR